MPDSTEKQKEQVQAVKNKSLVESKKILIDGIKEKGTGSIKVHYLKQAIDKNIKDTGALGKAAKAFSGSYDLFVQLDLVDPNYRVIIGPTAIPLIETL